MNVIVFGATGSIGQLTVRQLLKDGHKVTAFARTPGKLTTTDPALTLAKGDATNRADVDAALPGHDAVVVVIGAGPRHHDVRSTATLTIIQAMQAHGIHRLVCQSTLGAHESWANLNFLWKRIMFGLLLRAVFKDHLRQEDMVRASGLDWTIVRPSAFTDTPTTGEIRVGFPPSERKLKLKIARTDLAAFLSRQVAERGFIGRAVAIST